MFFKEPIDRGLFLTAGLYLDVFMIHIRQYEARNGGPIPVRKGVAFTEWRWATFMAHLREIDRCVYFMTINQPVSYHQHIGSRYYVTIIEGVKLVHIRRYILPNNSLKERATRSGIALTIYEWNALMPKIRLLYEQLPELDCDFPCYSKVEHMNQRVCRECIPHDIELLALSGVV